MSERGRRNILTGQVISDKMDKAISVSIYKMAQHPKYKKYVKTASVFKAHDEENKAKTGDKVRIFETRALSKTKRWKLLSLVSSAGEKEDMSALKRDEELIQKIREKKPPAESSLKAEPGAAKPEGEK